MIETSTYPLDTEILVIGSGAGGAITAATLAEAGRTVMIVEEGSHVDTAGLSTHSALTMPLLYRNGGLTPFLGKPTIIFAEGCCVGGSTEINSGFWYRTPPEAIARWRELFNVQELSSELLNPLFEEIEAELGVSTLNPDRSLPPSSEVLRQGAERLGWKCDQVPRVQRTNPVASQFVPNAHRSMSRTYIRRALSAGARLLPNCRVTRIHHTQSQVTHVSAILKDGNGQRPIKIKIAHVFVCAGAIQTALLLRSSGIKPNVGETLHTHPMIKVAALFDEQLDAHMSPPPLYQIKEFWPDITLGGAVYTPGFLAVTLSENWDQNEGALHNWRHMALFYAACRGTGHGSIRALPTLEPLARYRLTDQDRINLNMGLAKLCEALFAGGARKVYLPLRGRAVLQSKAECEIILNRPLPAEQLALSAVHAFSTCPMGEKRQICATDSFGRVHGFANLFIGDASIIPDAPGVNPQGTVMVLALRNARFFLDQA